MTIVAFPQQQADDAQALPAGFEGVPAVMSPKTLGDLLELSPRTLERWRLEKTGPAYHSLPGSSLIRYSRADVIAWLAAARVETTS
jgi:hypothetical protein